MVALAAASLSQSIAKACSSGLTAKCGCAAPSQSVHLTAASVDSAAVPSRSVTSTTLFPIASANRGGPQRPSDSSGKSSGGKDFQWGGCGDDVAYGIEFGRKFESAKWARKAPSLKSLNNQHNQQVGRKVSRLL